MLWASAAIGEPFVAESGRTRIQQSQENTLFKEKIKKEKNGPRCLFFLFSWSSLGSLGSGFWVIPGLGLGESGRNKLGFEDSSRNKLGFEDSDRNTPGFEDSGRNTRRFVDSRRNKLRLEDARRTKRRFANSSRNRPGFEDSGRNMPRFEDSGRISQGVEVPMFYRRKISGSKVK